MGFGFRVPGFGIRIWKNGGEYLVRDKIGKCEAAVRAVELVRNSYLVGRERAIYFRKGRERVLYGAERDFPQELSLGRERLPR